MHSLTRCLPLVVASIVACARGEQPAFEAAQPDSVSMARARAAADGLGGDLVRLLTSEMQRGGPEAAIAVCSDSAQVRTARHSDAGVAVRRVGTRVRNPANAPDSIDEAVLSAFGAAIEANRPMPDTAFIHSLADGTREVRYMRAIRLQEMCLACHGAPESFAPAVQRVLAAKYPDDRATGYAVGDLRGAISVRVGIR